MSRHPLRDFRNFYVKDVPQKVFCPSCRRVVRCVVAAEAVTYLVHALDDVCVIDGEMVGDAERKS